jgi:hypothetical protein
MLNWHSENNKSMEMVDCSPILPGLGLDLGLAILGLGKLLAFCILMQIHCVFVGGCAFVCAVCYNNNNNSTPVFFGLAICSLAVLAVVSCFCRYTTTVYFNS